MKLPIRLIVLVVLLLPGGCSSRGKENGTAGSAPTLAQARQGHQTRLIRQVRAEERVEKPPTSELSLVRYPSPAGELAAYVSAPLGRGPEKRPAIIWIFGGFDNGIGATAWEDATPDNDQSARAFRAHGIVTMYPSLRGGNDNPGVKEGFYGEVDDVVAAAKWLAQQPYVDPKRIYLGGHSTGGTLALLAAEYTGGFRAVFSFGPVEDVTGYGPENLPFDMNDRKEVELRAPMHWLHGINRPTYIVEGADMSGNIGSVQTLAAATRNPYVQCYAIPGHDHFSVLAYLTPILAEQIAVDTGPEPRFRIPGRSLSP